MAEIIVVSHIRRNTSKQNIANLVRYMGTREGAVRAPSAEKPAPATVRQQRLIKDLLQADGEAKKYSEYIDYEREPTKQRATEFIDAFIDRNEDRLEEIDKLVKYMAERPGVEKLGSHGLFSQTDDAIDLDAAAEEVGAHAGPIWSHVVSLHREDAERLGYTSAKAWRDLVRRNVMELAKAHKLDPENLQWYGAFHDTGDHPHMHLLVFSKDVRQGWLTKQGIAQIKSCFGNDIFRLEQQKLSRMETELRDKLSEDFRLDLQLMEREAAVSYEPTAEPVLLMQRLSRQLKNCKGKKYYSYLPKDVKKTVDELTALLAKHEGIAALYREWNKVNREKLGLYREKMEPDLPLEDNKEFRKLKNMIIKAADSLPLPEPPTEQPVEAYQAQPTETEPVSQAETDAKEQAQNEARTAAQLRMEYVFSEDRSTAVYVPACIPEVLKGLVYVLASMLADGQRRKLNKLRGQVDRKLRSKIEEKRAAHGIKTDGIAYYSDPYNEDQSL